MSSRRGRQTTLLLAVFGVVVCCAVAGTASGIAGIVNVQTNKIVSVYSNNMNNKPQYREIKTVTSGNKCKRQYQERRKQMEISTTEGPRHCYFKPPVQGSNPQPDHRWEARARMLTKTPSSIRLDAYLSLSARVGGGDRYELRVFPKDREFEIRRKPGGANFPHTGSNNAIKPMGEANQLRLIVEGTHVRAIANGTQLADVNDPQAGQIRGAKVEFGVGNLKNTSKPTLATFDGLKLAVPDP